jgi:hypothetical protein
MCMHDVVYFRILLAPWLISPGINPFTYLQSAQYQPYLSIVSNMQTLPQTTTIISRGCLKSGRGNQTVVYTVIDKGDGVAYKQDCTCHAFGPRQRTDATEIVLSIVLPEPRRVAASPAISPASTLSSRSKVPVVLKFAVSVALVRWHACRGHV